jgi:hypothetical protein
LNHVDVRQPSKKVAKPNKLEEGGMMADGGEIRGGIRYVKGKELEWVGIMSFDIATYGDKEAERKAYEYIQDSIKYWNGELNEDDFRVRKSGSGGYLSSWEVMRQFPKYADGGMMAKGGRLKSALMRDRAYKSNEPYEQAYKRKTRPKNPKYNYGFFEDGGSTEMHRAYAMGGVLQHGLESGDFIVSHDEGKMVVMNGGSKYEVNIHSGSRTKID